MNLCLVCSFKWSVLPLRQKASLLNSASNWDYFQTFKFWYDLLINKHLHFWVPPTCLNFVIWSVVLHTCFPHCWLTVQRLYKVVFFPSKLCQEHHVNLLQWWLNTSKYLLAFIKKQPGWSLWAVTSVDNLWTVTGCWNQSLLLLPPWSRLGISVVNLIGLLFDSSPPHPPVPPEQSHTGTNSHLPHTLHACYTQPPPGPSNTELVVRFRVGLNVGTAGFTI